MIEGVLVLKAPYFVHIGFSLNQKYKNLLVKN